MAADLMRMIVSCFCLLLSAVAPPLQQICPVEWRGVPASTAFEELQARFKMTVAVRANVDPARLGEEVRLSASHLTGEQVFRWVARISKLDVLFTEDSVIITPMGQGTNKAAVGTSTTRSVWPASAARRTSIHWNDTPLSRVSDDISAAFDVDVIFDAPVADDADLVTLEEANADLQTIAQGLAKQLEASVELLDGALWVHRPAVTRQNPITRPDSQIEQPKPQVEMPEPPKPNSRPASRSQAISPSTPLAKTVSVPPGIAGWREWGQQLSQAAGCPILMDIPAGAVYPRIEAVGSLIDILEAGRVLGLFTWLTEPATTGHDFTVRIRVRESG
jgi:hypothetical protein